MKGRVVHLDRIGDRDAAALVVDGQLQDLLIDPPDDRALPGAIYRALPDRPVKGLGGLFVRLPQGTGFLKGGAGIVPGKPLIVQATGPADDGKAVPVTTRLLFKSRLAIVTPGAPGLNISRRIDDADLRAGLQALAETAMTGADPAHGLILRSAAALADPAEIAEDIAAMRDLAAAVTADLTGGPELLVEGATAHDTAWRDWADPPPDEVAEGRMEADGILDLIDALRVPTVPLAGGARMTIEPTRALVAVDVDTGPDSSPAAGLRASIAAARDLPRQLRLRGLAGQIVIDFAPVPKRDRGTLDQVLRAAFRPDGTDVHLAGWTVLGLYELTRRRDRLPLARLLEGAP